MSEQTAPIRSGSARRWGFHIRWQVGLGLILAVLAVGGLVADRLVGTGGKALDADRIRSLADLGSAAADLAHQLQLERAAAAAFLAGSGPLIQYRNQWPRTNSAADGYAAKRRAAQGVPADLRPLLTGIDSGLRELERLRPTVTSRNEVSLTAAVFQYRILIADLVSYRDALADHGVDRETTDLARAGAALTRAKEFLAQEHVIVLRIVALHPYGAAQHKELIGAIAGRQDALRAFTDAATPTQRARLEQTVTGKDVVLAATLESRVLSTPVGGEVTVNLSDWNQAMGVQADLVSGVEAGIAAELVQHLGDHRDDQVRQALVGAGAAVLLVLIAIIITLLVVLGLVAARRRSTTS